MRVIGLDLSLNGTGICVSDERAFTIFGKLAQGDRRLIETQDAVSYYVDASRAQLAVIEGLPFGNNDRMVALVHGAARVALARLHVPFAYIYPNALKAFATGNGNSEKTAMRDVAVSLGASPGFDLDQSDAWWLRRAGLAAARQVLMTPEQATTLGKVEWPEIVEPYGPPTGRKPVTKKCKHNIVCQKSGDWWLHPFKLPVCDMPPM
jgi:Holliday junction resolvasome RuvABC endonuclease subunit